MDSTPYTERSNPITENVDVSSPTEMVQLLRQTDEEIFAGVGMENLFSQRSTQSMADLANLVLKTFEDHSPTDVAIVLAGCGTSGRLGYLISKICNNLSENILGGRPFHYSIAGGDKSILTSQEAPEDNPEEGVSSLVKICRGKKKVIYVGITGGISAPFVGGQLEYCMKHLDVFTPVLLGFNPVTMARNVAITDWNKTMKDVATDMEALCKSGKAFIINPVVGAEAITGSSRMKGGSATKIILEATFLSALNRLEAGKTELITGQNISATLQLYEAAFRKFYDSKACDVMASLVQRCGNALKSGGSLRYLATGWMGVIPLIDSTECPPTFGSSVNDVRGFVHRGYDFLGIEDYGKEDNNFRLGLDDFIAMYRDSAIGHDEVIAFFQSSSDPMLASLKEDLGSTLRGLKDSNKTVAVVLQKPSDPLVDTAIITSCFSEVLLVQFPDIDNESCQQWAVKCRNALQDSLYGCCLKWLVNAVSTGGHVLLGKVYKNYMCDVKVSNNKLYHRAIEIIKKMCPEVSHDKAEKSLLKSIYETDDITGDIKTKEISEHYKFACTKDKVVPLAVILTKLDCTFDEAKQTMKKYSVIRKAILEITKT